MGDGRWAMGEIAFGTSGRGLVLGLASPAMRNAQCAMRDAQRVRSGWRVRPKAAEGRPVAGGYETGPGHCWPGPVSVGGRPSRGARGPAQVGARGTEGGMLVRGESGATQEERRPSPDSSKTRSVLGLRTRLSASGEPPVARCPLPVRRVAVCSAVRGGGEQSETEGLCGALTWILLAGVGSREAGDDSLRTIRYLGSRGRSSTRSPMMLRMISSEPPAILTPG